MGSMAHLNFKFRFSALLAVVHKTPRIVGFCLFYWFLLSGVIYAGETLKPIPAEESPKNFAPLRNQEKESRPIFSPDKSAEAAPISRQTRQPNNPLATATNTDNPAPNMAPAKINNSTPTFAVTTILIIVAVVLCLLILLLKRYSPNAKALFSTPAMEILGRTQVDRQKYFALLRVGRRVIVVGVNPDGFNALSEITEPSEVTELLTIAKPQNKAGKNVFLDLFKKQVNESENASELSEIQTRVKNLSEDGG